MEMQNHSIDQIQNLQFEVILESMLDGVVIHDRNGKIIQFNSSALRILGLEADQLMGLTSFDPRWKAINEDGSIASPENHPSSIARRTGHVQKNKIMGVYLVTGELRWMSITAVPIIENGISIQTVVTFTDITEQRQTTERLLLAHSEIEKRRRELDNIINTIPVLIGHWDVNLINIHSNRFYSDYFGKTPEQIKGTHIKELLGPSLFKLNLPFIERVLRGESQTFERDIPISTGETKNTIASYIPEFYEDRVIGFFVIVTDISEIKRMQEERREIEIKLFNSNKMSFLGEMASGVAHEINNPLACSLGYIGMLKDQIQSDSRDQESILRCLRKFEFSLDRIAKIVNGLSIFSRDSLHDPYEYVQISTLLERTIDLCRERLSHHSIQLIIENYVDLKLNCRPSQITQVLLTIINNAYDAIEGHKEKWIKINIVSNHEKVIFRIYDSGKGIKPDIAEKIMNPFFTTKDPSKATGLGLAMAKSIIKDHKGCLSYIPDSKNTLFQFDIPLK